MRHSIVLCLFLLLMVSCQPPPLAATPSPSLTPLATVTDTTSPAPFTPTVEPSAITTPQPTLTATVDRSLTPPMTREVSFSYHFWSGQLIAFGGLDPNPGGCNPCNETWVWQAFDHYWSKIEPAHVPPARSSAAMAYDAAHMTVVLFGGATTQHAFDDTWLWDGQDWNQVHPKIAPTPRLNARMTYDYAHDQVVLWGGWYQGEGQTDYSFYSDTWTWDGQTWTRHDVPGPGNGAIPPASLAYDGNLKQVVMWHYGTGLWTWDGAAWHQQKIVNGPDLFTEGQIGFDQRPFHSQLVLRGSTNADPNPSAKTWTFDGKTWTLAEASVPGSENLQDAQMVYTMPFQGLLYITPTGGKSGPSGLKLLAWNYTTWVDAAAYQPPPPPVTVVNNLLQVSNRTALAVCVQVEDPASKGAQAEFRQTVQHLLDTRLAQWPDWKTMYGTSAYRVDAGCPSSPHVGWEPIVEIPSIYQVHLYVVSAGAARDIEKTLSEKGLLDVGFRDEAYERFGDTPWTDSFFPVTTALYLTPEEMRNPTQLEKQLLRVLKLQP